MSTDFALQNVSQQQKGMAVQQLVGREAQQIQGMVFMAKQYQRDEQNSFNRIMKACSRLALAEDSMYEYPRGGKKVVGPSIRLAEALAQNWGNIDFGIVELEQRDDESTVMSYAWDLETNTRQTKIFAVKHERSKKDGNVKLSDPRDIYELVANQGARRLRACILGIIPGDVVDKAVDRCMDTLKKGNSSPLSDRIRDMMEIFSAEHGVDTAMLEKFIGCKSSAFSENDIIRLRGVYKSLKDGMGRKEDYFDLNATVESEANRQVIDINPGESASPGQAPPEASDSPEEFRAEPANAAGPNF